MKIYKKNNSTNKSSAVKNIHNFYRDPSDESNWHGDAGSEFDTVCEYQHSKIRRERERERMYVWEKENYCVTKVCIEPQITAVVYSVFKLTGEPR